MSDLREKLTEAIRVAVQALEEAEVPSELREPAFGKVMDVLLADQGLMAGSAGGVAAAGWGAEKAGGSPGDVPGDDDPLKIVADKAGVTLAQIKDVFSFEDGEVKLVVGAKRFDRAASKASRDITLLLAGGRQAAQIEEWTPLKVTREACEHYGRLDGRNYQAAVKRLDPELTFRNQGAAREVRVTMPGWDTWRELVQDLLGGPV